MAAFSDDDLAGFLLDLWTPCVSSNVEAARYDADAEDLRVKFLSGPAVYRYPGVPFALAEHFGRAASKGGWVRALLVKPGRRFVKE